MGSAKMIAFAKMIGGEGGGGGDNWKTVTTDSEYTKSPTEWGQYLEIPVFSDTTDKNMYVAIYNNNTSSNYPVNMILWVVDGNGSIKSYNYRENFVSGGSNVLRASSGSIIKIYRLSTDR